MELTRQAKDDAIKFFRECINDYQEFIIEAPLTEDTINIFSDVLEKLEYDNFELPEDDGNLDECLKESKAISVAFEKRFGESVAAPSNLDEKLAADMQDMQPDLYKKLLEIEEISRMLARRSRDYSLKVLFCNYGISPYDVIDDKSE